MMLAATAGTFSHAHIAVTATISGALAAVVGAGRLTSRPRLLNSLAVGVLAGLAVYLFRASANLPQLNNDGIAGYSANDWLAPAVTYIVLGIYADLRPPVSPKRFAQVRGAATILAFAVNVITI